MKKDIAKLNIPNVCFSLCDPNKKVYKEQRTTRGFDDSETWSLSDTIANFIIPRLGRYIELANETIVRSPELIVDTDLFLEAMKLVARENGNRTFTKEEQEIVTKGCEAFPKIFMSLWW